jgi:hypothetical protein
MSRVLKVKRHGAGRYLDQHRNVRDGLPSRGPCQALTFALRQLGADDPGCRRTVESDDGMSMKV